ncbi:Protein of unknown function [Gryllus bimaculatus]|nr:Protein of unknown function [Gryllus bimaculatus]
MKISSSALLAAGRNLNGNEKKRTFSTVERWRFFSPGEDYRNSSRTK